MTKSQNQQKIMKRSDNDSKVDVPMRGRPKKHSNDIAEHPKSKGDPAQQVFDFLEDNLPKTSREYKEMQDSSYSLDIGNELFNKSSSGPVCDELDLFNDPSLRFDSFTNRMNQDSPRKKDYSMLQENNLPIRREGYGNSANCQRNAFQNNDADNLQYTDLDGMLRRIDLDNMQRSELDGILRRNDTNYSQNEDINSCNDNIYAQRSENSTCNSSRYNQYNDNKTANSFNYSQRNDMNSDCIDYRPSDSNINSVKPKIESPIILNKAYSHNSNSPVADVKNSKLMYNDKDPLIKDNFGYYDTPGNNRSIEFANQKDIGGSPYLNTQNNLSRQSLNSNQSSESQSKFRMSVAEELFQMQNKPFEFDGSRLNFEDTKDLNDLMNIDMFGSCGNEYRAGTMSQYPFENNNEQSNNINYNNDTQSNSNNQQLKSSSSSMNVMNSQINSSNSNMADNPINSKNTNNQMNFSQPNLYNISQEDFIGDIMKQKNGSGNVGFDQNLAFQSQSSKSNINHIIMNSSQSVLDRSSINNCIVKDNYANNDAYLNSNNSNHHVFNQNSINSGLNNRNNINQGFNSQNSINCGFNGQNSIINDGPIHNNENRQVNASAQNQNYRAYQSITQSNGINSSQTYMVKSQNSFRTDSFPPEETRHEGFQHYNSPRLHKTEDISLLYRKPMDFMKYNQNSYGSRKKRRINTVQWNSNNQDIGLVHPSKYSSLEFVQGIGIKRAFAPPAQPKPTERNSNNVLLFSIITGNKEITNEAMNIMQNFKKEVAQLDFTNVTVFQLKAIMKDFGLNHAGKKNELIDRVKSTSLKVEEYCNKKRDDLRTEPTVEKEMSFDKFYF
jgi:SAP domain